jgi:D,D-heptose 1,7-bisphosphate phosphatase
METRAVFLDKDGTLVEDVPYNGEMRRLQLLPGATAGLRLLQAAGYRLLLVSNQSGVARGYFPEEALPEMARHLTELLAEDGVTLAGCYWCPHHPDGVVAAYAVRCLCRKPEPGLLLRAAREHGLDLGQSWMIGDKGDDVKAGRRAGCRTVLLGAQPPADQWVGDGQPHLIAADLTEAARLLLAAGNLA